MKKKIRVGILFGGRSAEHEVSIQSAKNVYEALDKAIYDPVLIGISKEGVWFQLSQPEFRKLANKGYQALPAEIRSKSATSGVKPLTHQLMGEGFHPYNKNIDVVFPVLHGPYGEDGTVQGLLRLMGVPYVGADVLGSAVGMDKDVMKRLLRDAGLPVVRFIPVRQHERGRYSFVEVKKELGLPFFVKPANLGSSVGVSKVTNSEEYEKAVQEAFQFDRKILLEQGVDAREIECSVLGNEEKIASLPGEVIPTHEFYDYEAKYLDENGAALQIPAKLPQRLIKKMKGLAIQACTVLCADGMARVDFFLERGTNEVYLNEINTIPGFTNISMYPKLWEASGISYTELIDRLIQLAFERFTDDSRLKTQRI